MQLWCNSFNLWYKNQFDIANFWRIVPTQNRVIQTNRNFVTILIVSKTFCWIKKDYPTAFNFWKQMHVAQTILLRQLDLMTSWKHIEIFSRFKWTNRYHFKEFIKVESIQLKKNFISASKASVWVRELVIKTFVREEFIVKIL